MSDKITIEVSDLSKVSDGYRTIAELYDHRCLLFINLAIMHIKNGGLAYKVKQYRSQTMTNKAAEAAKEYAENKGNGIGDWFERKDDFLAGAK